MWLFKKKEQAIEKSRVYSFVQANGFRGFKRIGLTTYAYDPITKGIKNLSKGNPKLDFTGKTIILKEIDYDTFTEDNYNHCIIVLVDGNHVGTLFKRDENLYNKIIQGTVEKAYVKIEKDQDGYSSWLFLKFID